MASANNLYGSSASNRGAPPPPPKPAVTTTTRRTSATKMTPRATQAYQSSRSVAMSKPSGSNTPANAMPIRNNASSSMRSGTTKNRSSLSGARKAPVASRPVGSYYNSSAATDSEPANNGVGAANLYASQVPVAASTSGTTDTTDNESDTWDDWGSPAAAPSTTSTANPHSSWVAPAPSQNNTPAASTYGLYSTGGSAANASAAPPGYTSSGFIGLPTPRQQEQQQQKNPMQLGIGFYQNPDAQQQQQQQPFLSGAIDSSAPTMSAMNPNSNASMTNADGNTAPSAISSFSMFMPSATMEQQPNPSIEDVAPLLEELGINLQHMMLKTKAVVFPFSRFGGDQIDPTVICQDGDLPGPIALLLLLGGEMVLTGKLQFGYIYIYGLFGCIAMTLVVNLISPADAVSFWTVTSIMGYALLPVNILALIKIFIMNLIHMQTLGNILGGLTVLWSTMASTRLLELGCGLRDQRYLIMYPLLLFYSAFVMMTIL